MNDQITLDIKEKSKSGNIHQVLIDEITLKKNSFDWKKNTRYFFQSKLIFFSVEAYFLAELSRSPAVRPRTDGRAVFIPLLKNIINSMCPKRLGHGGWSVTAVGPKPGSAVGPATAVGLKQKNQKKVNSVKKTRRK